MGSSHYFQQKWDLSPWKLTVSITAQWCTSPLKYCPSISLCETAHWMSLLPSNNSLAGPSVVHNTIFPHHATFSLKFWHASSHKQGNRRPLHLTLFLSGLCLIMSLMTWHHIGFHLFQLTSYTNCITEVINFICLELCLSLPVHCMVFSYITVLCISDCTCCIPAALQMLSWFQHSMLYQGKVKKMNTCSSKFATARLVVYGGIRINCLTIHALRLCVDQIALQYISDILANWRCEIHLFCSI